MKSPADGYTVAEFSLKVGERQLQATAQIPAGNVRIADLLPVLRKFNDAVIGVAVADATDAGEAISCRAGCGACCRQPVPIGEAEAVALLEWADALPVEQQEELRERFRKAAERLEAKGMLERTRGSNALRERAEIIRFALDYFQAGVPCPFLVNESCSIHPIRPMKCREYLVTSPAVNCASPTAETIKKVDLPKSFSKILFHLEDHMAPGWGRWVPLVLLFEWGANHRQLPQRTAAGGVLFGEFLTALADHTPQELQEVFAMGGRLQGGKESGSPPEP
jgi:Fe-S-cluster containining protein